MLRETSQTKKDKPLSALTHRQKTPLREAGSGRWLPAGLRVGEWGAVGQSPRTPTCKMSKFWGLAYSRVTRIHNSLIEHLKLVNRGDLKCYPHTRKNVNYIKGWRCNPTLLWYRHTVYHKVVYVMSTVCP